MAMHTVLQMDRDGSLVVTDGIVHRLTPCCQASAKGSANSPTGVCCRACYQPIAQEMGDAWEVGDSQRWARWIEDHANASWFREAPNYAEFRPRLVAMAQGVVARALAATPTVTG